MARRSTLNLTRPTQGLWIVSLIIGMLGIIGHFVPIEGVSAYSFWLVTVGFLLLVFGVAVRGA